MQRKTKQQGIQIYSSSGFSLFVSSIVIHPSGSIIGTTSPIILIDPLPSIISTFVISSPSLISTGIEKGISFSVIHLR